MIGSDFACCNLLHKFIASFLMERLTGTELPLSIAYCVFPALYFRLDNALSMTEFKAQSLTYAHSCAWSVSLPSSTDYGLPPIATIGTRRELHKHRAPVAPRTPDFGNRTCAPNTRNPALFRLSNDLRGRRYEMFANYLLIIIWLHPLTRLGHSATHHLLGGGGVKRSQSIT